ncbi:lytic transglycosylase [bacteria symbiont BFo1 of Frankliniella occidentalis]|uniref:lytic transglycosylase domain-containing protein n=2 Tax=Erwinia TaxID=551 RepID=UPI0006645E47|nr:MULTISPECIES: lytic transglycosylase domain-containing protein [Erwinia]KMV66880.1 lytic transglycosylase [bacteria symbiont BFo1 of Frankliniella occidentalis]KYP82356.1 lytic transglycosylase [bacteria symbiont BFo1 of Frankliniella occidentalis]KYP87065.1 lytic transglycosylase [bacteria symbiont BFo1 of Frankliniella occidentalis]MDI3440256.1 lytic transglycosylase domain-containing protein [Erwinia sp. V90_4]CAH0297334.1 Membrane-bound lytic murein transglycosylase C [Erwinia aphidicol
MLLLVSGLMTARAATGLDLHACFRSASERYLIDHRLLIAIAEVESSMNPKAIGLNKKKGKILSEDIGLMQINSSWFPVLVKMGITRESLLSNPCQNIYVGAWILAKNIAANGVNWESVGAYNAGFRNANAPFRLKYAKKVYARYLVLTGEE